MTDNIYTDEDIRRLMASIGDAIGDKVKYAKTPEEERLWITATAVISNAVIEFYGGTKKNEEEFVNVLVGFRDLLR
jgi:hypothetical protein